jgi:DNA processing protein
MTTAPSGGRERDVVAWVRLAGTAGVGPIAFRQLIERAGSAVEALRILPDLAARAGRKKPPRVMNEADARAQLADATRLGIRPLLQSDGEYPALLRQIEDAPSILWIKGGAEFLAGPCVAVVGARNASLAGRKLAKAWSADLAAAGLTVVSGLARGIDGAAHEGALGKGKTAAVMAGGIDAIYPPEHRALWTRIAESGVVVSEMPPGTEPLASYFPRRNRIISGLSMAVLVVEATPKSGSLITARCALDQGRDVLAVPGFPFEPRAQGPNDLIRDGATLVQSVDDILAALGPLGTAARRPDVAPAQKQQPIDNNEENGSNALHPRLLALIGPQPVQIDELIRECQTSAPVAAQALLELELAGLVVRLPGNRVASAGPS